MLAIQGHFAYSVKALSEALRGWLAQSGESNVRAKRLSNGEINGRSARHDPHANAPAAPPLRRPARPPWNFDMTNVPTPQEIVPTPSTYGSDNITVLEGLEAVR